MNSPRSKLDKLFPKLLGCSLVMGVVSGLALLGNSYWRPWMITAWSGLLLLAGWAFIVSVVLKLNKDLRIKAETKWGEKFLIIFGKVGMFALAIYGLFLFTIFTMAFWLFTQPSIVSEDANKTIYQQCVWLEDNDCTYTESNSWFTRKSSSYSPNGARKGISNENPFAVEPTAPTESSSIETPTGKSTPVESTTPQPHTPATSAVSEDSLIHTPVEVPGAGSAHKLSVVQDGDFYQSVQQVNGEWVRGGDITEIGMHREVYDVIPLDDHVWVIGFGTPDGGENFITTDAGATWSAFLPEGFVPGGSEPSFLEKAKADKEGYSITANYPSWVTSAGEGVTFVSADGVEWEKE